MDEMDEWTAEDQIAGMARGDYGFLEAAVALRERNLEHSGLDPRAHALVKIAALVALDAPTASYAWQVAAALDEGVTPDDLLGVLVAIAPQVGGPRVVSAAGEIAYVLDIAVEAAIDEAIEEMEVEEG
jgi:alkylhydroperoxidase/carboxymuconolactone decarboxylase family protein YurZ